MTETTRLQCRCGQQFTAWLINGAPRSRCPYCKAPISEATPVVVAPPRTPDDLPPVPPVRVPAAPVRPAPPQVPSVPYRLPGWLAPRITWRIPLALWARPCPRCHSDQIVRVHHTWWGGFLGTWLTHHVRCTACGCRFNGRTGEQDSYAIVTILAARAALLLILAALALGVWMLTKGSGQRPTSPAGDDQPAAKMSSY